MYKKEPEQSAREHGNLKSELLQGPRSAHTAKTQVCGFESEDLEEREHADQELGPFQSHLASNSKGLQDVAANLKDCQEREHKDLSCLGCVFHLRAVGEGQAGTHSDDCDDPSKPHPSLTLELFSEEEEVASKPLGLLVPFEHQSNSAPCKDGTPPRSIAGRPHTRSRKCLCLPRGSHRSDCCNLCSS